MSGVFPELENGAVVVRTIDGDCTGTLEAPNAYCPPATFTSSCQITALTEDCVSRIKPAQINALTSELLCLAATLTPDGHWDCNSQCNLGTAFVAWAEGFTNSFVIPVDEVTITGGNGALDPLTIIPEGVAHALVDTQPVRAIVATGLLSDDVDNLLVLDANDRFYIDGNLIVQSICATAAYRTTLVDCIVTDTATNLLKIDGDGRMFVAIGDIVAQLCDDIEANADLAECLVSGDSGNGLRQGTDGKLYAPNSAQVGVPIGTIIDVYGNGTTPPVGYIRVVPGLEITAAFPELRTWALANGWATNGSGNPVFPASDALFKRQRNPGQTRDAGRVFGTVQEDAFQDHGHTVPNTIGVGSGIDPATGANNIGGVVNNTSAATLNVGSGVPRRAIETRPANITVTWYIKAYDDVTGAASVDVAMLASELAALKAQNQRFTSAQQVITSAALLTIPHGMSAVPQEVSFKLICLIAQANYAVGDEVFVFPADNSGGIVGGSSWVDATNVYFRFSNAATCFVIADKTTGVRAALTNANWRLIVRART